MPTGAVRRFPVLLVVAGLLASGCYTFRGTASDKTEWDELPKDPRPELWIQGSPRVSVVFDGVYTSFDGQEPVRDEKYTDIYRRLLRRSQVFTAMHEDGAPATDDAPRVRVTRSFHEKANHAANFAKAATVPGLLGYRHKLEATFTLEMSPPEGEGEPSVYEARSRITRIYHHSGQMDDARRLLYQEADRANIMALIHQLRADPELFDALERVAPSKDRSPEVGAPAPL